MNDEENKYYYDYDYDDAETRGALMAAIRESFNDAHDAYNNAPLGNDCVESLLVLHTYVKCMLENCYGYKL